MMTEQDTQEQGCYTEYGVSGYGVAVKLHSESLLDETRVRQMAEDMMLAIAVKCMERGAKCIGHIKSHLVSEAGTLKADTIGVKQGAHSTGRIDRPVETLYMAVNSIVQGIREEEVRGATLDGIHEVAEGRGVAVEKEKEHAYFDEFDFTASKQDFIRQLQEQFAAEDGSGGERGNGP